MSIAEISQVKHGSLAEKYGIKAGDKLVAINGRKLRDVLDYQICLTDEELELKLIRRDSTSETIKIKNPDYENLGILFSTSLFDGIKTCANKCVFCFIDQLPPGMRESVYVKDDDYRLSFLYGNFVTLTNMHDDDIERIIEDRISPLYVSLHATNQELRAMMLGRKKTDKTLEYLKKLSESGIEIHIQMVMCPGLNDGDELERSIQELSNDYPGVESVGLVPVGLTGYREGLYPLHSFNKQEIIELINQVERWQARFEEEKGYAWVYIADEFYIAVGRELPPVEHYGEFPQIENGIGLSSLFIREAREAMGQLAAGLRKDKIAVVTGQLFSKILESIVGDINKNFGSNIRVVPVQNIYFGGKVNVTGLLTGSDIVASVKSWIENFGKPDILVLPDVLLNADGLMLDGYVPKTVSDELGVRVEVFEGSGAGFIEGLKKVSGE